MKKLLTIFLVAVAASAGAALVDQYTLANDSTFQQRVEQSMLEAAVSISSEADSTAFHRERIALASKAILDPSQYALLFSKAVATNDAVAAAAGSPPVQASVTDAQINTAISSVWDALAGARVIR
jgi:hypothetical protein